MNVHCNILVILLRIAGSVSEVRIYVFMNVCMDVCMYAYTYMYSIV